MKKKNGFTLVELLAVIVVLAIIMIIAIPSVLDTMNNARKSAFIQYAQKIVKDAQTSYVSDSQTTIPGSGIFIYDIATDLGYTSHGNYNGYVVVDAAATGNLDDPHYIFYLQDPNYMVLGWDVTGYKDYPDNDALSFYDQSQVAEKMGNALRVCKDVISNSGVEKPENYKCMNRKNYIISEAETPAEE